MSHYHTIVLIDPDVRDVRAEIAKMLAPFDENVKVAPYPVVIDGANLEMMVSCYKTDDVAEFAARMMDWKGRPGFVEDGKLYYESTRNPNSKWDFYRIGGRWDGTLFGVERTSDRGFNFAKHHETLEYNMRPVKDLPDFDALDCYAILTPKGEWLSVGRMGWWGMSHDEMTLDKYKSRFVKTLEEYKHCVAVCIDCHI